MTHGNVSKRIGWALASTEDFDGAAPCCAALCRVVKTPPQRTPRGPQDVPNELKEGSNTFQMSSNNNRKQYTPRYVQDTLKIRPRYASPEAQRYARYLRHPSQTALPDTLSTRKSRYAQIRPDTLPDTPPPARGARSARAEDLIQLRNKTNQDGPKTRPRGPQEAPKTAQAPRGPQEAPKMAPKQTPFFLVQTMGLLRVRQAQVPRREKGRLCNARKICD